MNRKYGAGSRHALWDVCDSRVSRCPCGEKLGRLPGAERARIQHFDGRKPTDTPLWGRHLNHERHELAPSNVCAIANKRRRDQSANSTANVLPSGLNASVAFATASCASARVGKIMASLR